MKPKKRLATVAKHKPELFPEDRPSANGRTAVEEAPAPAPAPAPALPASPPPESREYAELMLAYGGGVPITVEQAKRDVQDCFIRVFDDFVTIGQRLLFIKEQLPHGEFGRYLEEEFPQSFQRAYEYMLIAQRVMEGKIPHIRAFYQAVAGGSKKKALLLLGTSDEEIEEAVQAGVFAGKPLSEVGELSYRQLKEEIRKLNRDLDRTREARDKAESQAADLQEENRLLKDVHEGDEVRPLTRLEIAFGRATTATARFLGEAQEAARSAEEEVLRDGPGYIARLMQDFNLIAKALQPWDPADMAEIRGEEEGVER